MDKSFVYELDCGRFRLTLGRRTLIMGVLNVTPDSFSDGGLFFDTDNAVAHGKAMAAAGADIIDLGGESTRPFSAPVPIEEEIRRVVPVIQKLSESLSIPISIDTSKGEVWYFTVKPCDGVDYGETITSPSLTIGNVSPSVDELSLIPERPITTDDLTCEYKYVDADDDIENGTEIK